MDKYVYINSEVLKNKFGIIDEKELARKERTKSSIRLLEILDGEAKIKHTFDLEHLQKIHKYLFQDIYTWAGKIRDVDIAKGDTLFCKAINIDNFSKEIFSKLQRENFFKGTTKKEELVEKLATLFLDINALHPFREGNGRSQREFIRELAEERGYNLDFKNISKEEMIELSIRDNPKEVAKIFLENIREKKDISKDNPWTEKANSDKDNLWIKKEDKNKESEWEL